MGGGWNGERVVCAERAQFNWIGNRSLSQLVVPLIYGKCIMQGGLRRQSNYRRSTRPPNASTPMAFHRNYQFTSTSFVHRFRRRYTATSGIIYMAFWVSVGRSVTGRWYPLITAPFSKRPLTFVSRPVSCVFCELLSCTTRMPLT